MAAPSQKLLYALVARGTVVLAEHRYVRDIVLVLRPIGILRYKTTLLPLRSHCSIVSGNANLIAMRILEKIGGDDLWVSWHWIPCAWGMGYKHQACAPGVAFCAPALLSVTSTEIPTSLPMQACVVCARAPHVPRPGHQRLDLHVHGRGGTATTCCVLQFMLMPCSTT